MQKILDWNKAYSVAHPALDAEHRDIMVAMAHIAQVSDNSCDPLRLRPLLCALKERATAHFAHEDAILREVVAFTSSAHCSRRFLAAMSEALIEDHLVEHAHALSVLDSMIRDTLAQASPREHPLGETLTHWFVNHAVKHAAHLKTLFQTIEKDCPELLTKLG